MQTSGYEGAQFDGVVVVVVLLDVVVVVALVVVEVEMPSVLVVVVVVVLVLGGRNPQVGPHTPSDASFAFDSAA
jgi:hypothetical protein